MALKKQSNIHKNESQYTPKWLPVEKAKLQKSLFNELTDSYQEHMLKSNVKRLNHCQEIK